MLLRPSRSGGLRRRRLSDGRQTGGREPTGGLWLVWSRITLHAVVRGNEVSTEFTVTETSQRQGRDWKLLALTFSSVRDTHTIKK